MHIGFRRDYDGAVMYELVGDSVSNLGLSLILSYYNTGMKKQVLAMVKASGY